MAAFMIGYDKVPGRDYTALHDALKGCGTWWHYLDSTWIVVTTDSASEVRDKVAKALDKDDLLLVVQLQGTWASWGLNDKANAWLKTNM